TAEEIDDVMYDARAGDLESLKAFLDSRPASCLASIRDEYSLATPLHYAAANGHLDVVKYLLELIKRDPTSNGGLLKVTNESGNIALHWAALNGHLAIVTALCEAGSDPFIKNNADHDSYYEAESNEHEEVIDYLLKKFDIEPVELNAEDEA
ncbi:ankyrin, partial [Nadsonia fulvescens var. elongata DSM 6958]